MRDKNAKYLRAENFIPAVCYGAKQDAVSLKVDYQTFRKMYSKAGTNTVIQLDGEGLDHLDVLVHDVDYDPVTDNIMHIDFLRIEKNKPVHAMVPIVITGKAPAVADLGGILLHHKHEVEIKCLPKDLIHEIEVDVTKLVDFHTSVHVSDLVVSQAVEILDAPDDVIVNVSAPKTETAEEPQPEVAPVAAEPAKEAA